MNFITTEERRPAAQYGALPARDVPCGHSVGDRVGLLISRSGNPSGPRFSATTRTSFITSFLRLTTIDEKVCAWQRWRQSRAMSKHRVVSQEPCYQALPKLRSSKSITQSNTVNTMMGTSLGPRPARQQTTEPDEWAPKQRSSQERAH